MGLVDSYDKYEDQLHVWGGGLLGMSLPRCFASEALSFSWGRFEWVPKRFRRHASSGPFARESGVLHSCSWCLSIRWTCIVTSVCVKITRPWCCILQSLTLRPVSVCFYLGFSWLVLKLPKPLHLEVRTLQSALDFCEEFFPRGWKYGHLLYCSHFLL